MGEQEVPNGSVLGGRYVIEERLGGGAMGTVYRAKHAKVGRLFAIKVLHRGLMTDPKVVTRFEREAELAARLRHTNLVSVIDVGLTYNGLRYMAMELAPGNTLSHMLIDGPFSEARTVDIAKQLCNGLQHAHEMGLVHRDFKPDNVILEQYADGREVARIVDFGVAILREDVSGPSDHRRLTTKGIVVGTPHYMAPEQARGDALDHRVDIFALGLLCYELLTGKLPFEGSGVDVARANLSTATPPMGTRAPELTIDPVLEAIVRHMLEKDRDRRPATANAVRELFELYERDRAAAAVLLSIDLPTPKPVEEPPRRLSRPHTVTNNDAVITTRAHTPSDSQSYLAVSAARAAPQLCWTRRVAAALAGIAVLALLWLVARSDRDEAASAVAVDVEPEATLTVADKLVRDESAPAVREPRPDDMMVPSPVIQAPRYPSPKVPRIVASQPELAASPSAAEVAQLYAKLGRELKNLEAKKGMDSTIDLWPRYRWIRINEWITTPQRRAQAAELLERLRSEVQAQ